LNSITGTTLTLCAKVIIWRQEFFVQQYEISVIPPLDSWHRVMRHSRTPDLPRAILEVVRLTSRIGVFLRDYSSPSDLISPSICSACLR